MEPLIKKISHGQTALRDITRSGKFNPTKEIMKTWFVKL
jgi:hypothetical protein